MFHPAPTLQPWIPGTKPVRVTPPRPRRKPAEGTPPAAPLELPVLPPRRVLPAPAAAPDGTPSAAAPGPALAPAAPTAGAPDPSTAAGPAGEALLAAGVTLYRRETLLARWDLDEAEFSALVDGGGLLTVPLDTVTRYVPAAAVPTHLRSAAVVPPAAAA
ncbi:hypothetical protein ACI78Q_00200 [Geodermatophilus sp. SYSU D00705]